MCALSAAFARNPHLLLGSSVLYTAHTSLQSVRRDGSPLVRLDSVFPCFGYPHTFQCVTLGIRGKFVDRAGGLQKHVAFAIWDSLRGYSGRPRQFFFG